MEGSIKYNEIILKELAYRVSTPIANAPEIERHLIVNDEQTEFVLITFGWHDKSYRHGLVFHIEIRDGKVWVHQDNTDVGIADRFADGGIPKSDIILGFLPKYAREVSGFAVA